MPELAQDAPVFDELGAKFNEPWLAHWINDPHAIRPHSLMPHVFAAKPGEVDQRAADLAAYLVSLGEPATMLQARGRQRRRAARFLRISAASPATRRPIFPGKMSTIARRSRM